MGLGTQTLFLNWSELRTTLEVGIDVQGSSGLGGVAGWGSLGSLEGNMNSEESRYNFWPSRDTWPPARRLWEGGLSSSS